MLLLFFIGPISGQENKKLDFNDMEYLLKILSIEDICEQVKKRGHKIINTLQNRERLANLGFGEKLHIFWPSDTSIQQQNLKKQLQQLGKEIKILQEKADNIDVVSINDIDKDIRSLNQQVTAIQSSVDSLYTRLGITKSDNNEKQIGAIGDIKYSLLPLDEFQKQNGSGWVLLAGQEIEKTPLALVLGIKKLPDARGVFLRGRNYNRSKNEGNPKGDLLVGTYQKDDFKSHGHKTTNANSHNGHGRPATGGDGSEGVGYHTSCNSGGRETRPRCITVNIYVKVY
ncbi:hypothetical protein UABAM_02919 [Candidatus Uabimicrobium amorphum]|uniref:Tail fiber protein n=2 Tax=Uabimicrobium amorphum TaxID=2596890 RepID=A0A5S9IMD3_UABAM|nr:hypothetical protein UABAM_02919 [Candidatus Uabimicrobium amorphum]